MVTVQMFSSLKATGVKELKRTLTGWLNQADEAVLEDEPTDAPEAPEE